MENRDTKTWRMVALDIVCIMDSLNQGDMGDLIWRLTETDYKPYNAYSEDDFNSYYIETAQTFGEKYSNIKDKEVVKKCLDMLLTVNPKDPWVL